VAAPARDPARATAYTLVACAILIAFAMINKDWVTFGKHYTETHMGPLGIEKEWNDAPTLDVPSDAVAARTAVVVTGIAAALGCLAYAGLVLGGKRDKVPPFAIGYGVLALAAASQCYLVLRITSSSLNSAAVSWGTLPGLGGTVLAIVMLRQLRKQLAPPPPALDWRDMPTMPTEPPRPRK
jgi:hypothetical protein